MRKILALLAFTLALAAPAQALTIASGRIVTLYADPNDFVIEADAAGSCGSKFFHIQRNHANFKEVTAVALAAFATTKKLIFFVESCAGDRNILSHAAAPVN